ncbi:Ig-like domain-containing protein [Bacillus salipaludis]|uniref:Ig-like domain-containing protein n=1 Tax=Bacillus salipaludis TaxID=2547811 RepID=A0AA90R032_9BACI|nr:Ig-like domain-containing protein [Bacillus salipaludis]MDQ6597638.1 Ig-like domain-containing protein [Bacillus salipaludis]
MKSMLLKAGLMTSLIFLGWSYKEASAEMLWPSKCASYEKIVPNKNPSTQHINCLLTSAALDAKIPPEVLKAVAATESDWRQFDSKGQPFKSQDGGIGIMQITNQTAYDQEKLKNDIFYNIQVGVNILNSMYNRTDLPKIYGAGREVIENWYFPVMAYNGTKPVNSPVYWDNGKRNPNAYQEKVFARIKQDSFLNEINLAYFPFTSADFEYNPGSDTNIIFKKKQYTITSQMHASRYYYQKGNKVVVTKDGVRLRSQPSTSSNSTTLRKGTTLIIDGHFTFDKTSSSQNQFVWYPVKYKSTDIKLAGYIPSVYISKKLNAPIVNPVDDHDRDLSGKAPSNVMIQIMNGKMRIGQPKKTDATGYYKITIPVHKAGKTLTVTYKDYLNEVSLSTTIKVIDKTPPAVPIVNKITNKAAIISGKTEAYAKVYVKIAKKTYSAKADRYGKYKVVIPVQNTGTVISVKAKDRANNVGDVRKITVKRVAPNRPTVNTVKYSSKKVTGKTEKHAKVTVKIGSKKYTAKANDYGAYKVNIPQQRAGTKLYVNAKDAKGKVSATKKVNVSK